MAVVPYPENSPETRSTLARMPPLNLFRMVAHSPDALRPFLRYGGALLAELDLDPVLRELAILRVAALTGCDYERIQHEQIATAVGCSPDQAAAASDVGRRTDGDAGAVLAFVDEAVGEHAVGTETLARVEAALGPSAVVELLLVVGHYLGIAILAQSVDLDLDDPAGAAVLGRAENQSSR
jgi:AhpD family alkylhydroperoxidase